MVAPVNGCDDATKFIGREAFVEIGFACPTEDPSTVTLLPIGAVTTKGLENSANAASVYADDSFGYDEELIVNSVLGVTLEGYSRREDGTRSNQTRLEIYYNNAVSAGRQPTVLLRYTRPNITATFYANIKSFSPSDPIDSASSFSVEFGKAPSDFAPTFVETV